MRRVSAALLPLALVAAACGDDASDADAGGDEATATTEPAAPEDEAPEVLRIQVTNDDGIDAPGIDSVVNALNTLDDVEIILISPFGDWSGSGDGKCEDKPEEERLHEDDVPEGERPCTYDDDGEMASSEEETLSGEPGIAVHGMPADSVEWAHTNYFVDDVEPPHLTVSGNNGGQNIGQVAYISGTVGAARESARHGVPGLAVSQGFGDGLAITDYDQLDYDAAVPFMLDWIEENREALLAGELDLDTVTSLNVPTCLEGEVRGLHETTRALEGPAFEPVDCESDEDPEGMDDIAAWLVGFATITPVDIEDPSMDEDED